MNAIVVVKGELARGGGRENRGFTRARFITKAGFTMLSKITAAPISRAMAITKAALILKRSAMRAPLRVVDVDLRRGLPAATTRGH